MYVFITGWDIMKTRTTGANPQKPTEETKKDPASNRGLAITRPKKRMHWTVTQIFRTKVPKVVPIGILLTLGYINFKC
jgi:hypothetical protein